MKKDIRINELVDAIGAVDDELLFEVDELRRKQQEREAGLGSAAPKKARKMKRSTVTWIGSLAACVVIVFAGGALLLNSPLFRAGSSAPHSNSASTGAYDSANTAQSVVTDTAAGGAAADTAAESSMSDGAAYDGGLPEGAFESPEPADAATGVTSNGASDKGGMEVGAIACEVQIRIEELLLEEGFIRGTITALYADGSQEEEESYEELQKGQRALIAADGTWELPYAKGDSMTVPVAAYEAADDDADADWILYPVWSWNGN